MNIASKITVVVALLAGLLITAAGYVGLSLSRTQTLATVREQGRLLVNVLKTAAEYDLRNHGQLGAIASLVKEHPGQSVVFYGPDARAIAPVPVESDPVVNARIRQVLESKEAKDAVIGTGDEAAYVNRAPLFTRTGQLAGAVELRVYLGDSLSDRSWLQTGTLIVGGLLVFFALVVGLFTHRSIGRPIARLMDGMDAVIRGDLTHAIPLDRNDEIGLIAYRFNEMTARLRAAQDAIRNAAEAKLQLEGSLRRSEKLATIGQLSAEIAHEVGTPLNVIGGRARTLRKKADQPAEVRKNAEIIAGQVARITKIIQQVLDLARVPVRRRERVDLLRVVDDAIAFLEYQLTHAQVSVRRDYPRDVPALEAEPDGLQQVVLNLLLNALQAMPRGGELFVRIATTHRRKGGLDLAPPSTFVALTVQDTGIGIPEEDRPRVFDPFFSTKAKGEGTGLGLTVVHGIVKEHDGWIELDAPEKGGTVFRVFFPLDANAAAIVEDPAVDESEQPARDEKEAPAVDKPAIDAAAHDAGKDDAAEDAAAEDDTANDVQDNERETSTKQENER